MEEQSTSLPSGSKGSRQTLGLIAIALFVLLGVGIVVLKSKSKSIPPTPVPLEGQSLSPTNSLEISETQPSSYQDGAFEATGNYQSPGGPEEIGVKLTLTGGVIENVEVTSRATLPKSKLMQADFVENYKPFVIGKNIDEVVLTKVSGSSLTPKGFNDALEKIKLEAKVGA